MVILSYFYIYDIKQKVVSICRSLMVHSSLKKSKECKAKCQQVCCSQHRERHSRLVTALHPASSLQTFGHFFQHL